jgi:hypothetical protein
MTWRKAGSFSVTRTSVREAADLRVAGRPVANSAADRSDDSLGSDSIGAKAIYFGTGHFFAQSHLIRPEPDCAENAAIALVVNRM